MCKDALLLVVAVLSLGFAPVPFPRPDRPDSSRSELQKLQGEWRRVRFTHGGAPQSAVEVTMVIADNHLTYFESGAPLSAWMVQLNTKKKLKAIDIDGTVGGVKGVCYRGVYQVSGETLTIWCRQSDAERDRPSDRDGAKPGVCVEVYQRVKR